MKQSSLNPYVFALLIGLVAVPFTRRATVEAAFFQASALEDDPRGWIDLLENADRDLEGWTAVPIPPGTPSRRDLSQWTYDKTTRVLKCSGKGRHEWLRKDREFDDFIYHVEWRFIPLEGDGKKNYNSGVMFRCSENGAIWHQAQTGDASGGFVFGDTPVQGKTKRINLMKQTVGKRVRPAGEWNTFEIRCEGNDVRLWVNGGTTVRWKECEYPKGFLGLEAEGYAIEFKNVKVKPIKKSSDKGDQKAKNR